MGASSTESDEPNASLSRADISADLRAAGPGPHCSGTRGTAARPAPPGAERQECSQVFNLYTRGRRAERGGGGGARGPATII